MSTPENKLAEEYARVVDFMGRLSGAVADGNLYYAWDKVSGLRAAINAFEACLGDDLVSEDGTAFRRFTGGGLDDTQVARTSVAFAREYRAGRLLHPPRS